MRHAGKITGSAVNPPKRRRLSAAKSKQPDYEGVDRVLSYTNYIAAGSKRKRDIALTFDDGPSSFTPQILAILRRTHTPATFFEIGREVTANPKIERRVLASGVPIGDHTQTHPLLPMLHKGKQAAQIQRAASDIKAAGAPYPRLFRPPYGGFNKTTLRILKAHRMLMVLWTVDTSDFSRPGVKKIVYSAVSGARPGGIILMHDGGGNRAQTVAALPRIIARLRRRHYHLVTVAQLLIDDPPARHQPPPTSLAGVG